MYYYVYRIDFEDGHYYIGSHQSETLEFDGYLGSSNYLNCFFKWHPKLKWTRTIISLHETRKKAFDAERAIIVPHKKDNLSINRKAC